MELLALFHPPPLHIRCKNNNPKPKEQPTSPTEMPKVSEVPAGMWWKGPALTLPVFPLEGSRCFPGTSGMRQKNLVWECVIQLLS